MSPSLPPSRRPRAAKVQDKAMQAWKNAGRGRRASRLIWPSSLGGRRVFLGTASAGGQPYIQHRGGPPGFLKVLDDKTLAFADFAGNRQYITLGNLTENPKAFVFLIDYRNRQRVK